MKRLTCIIGLALARSPAAAAHRTGARTADGRVLLRYQLWDTNQKPVYQKCADKFEQANPNIKIQIENKNWGDYWSGLARGFIAETAPDVFTDHLGKYPQFAQSEVIEPVSTRGIDMDQYLPGPGRAVEVPDRQAVRLPEGLGHRRGDRQRGHAGRRPASPSSSSTRRPGTRPTAAAFQQIVAKLTVDNNGKRGDQPGFDPATSRSTGSASTRRPHLRPDDLGRLRRQPRLQAARQEPVGHEVQLRRPALRADVHVVARHDPQGLHAVAGAGPHARPDRGVPERQGRAGDRRRLDDRHLLGDQGHQGRLLRRSRPARTAPGACTTGSRTRSGSAPSTSPRRASGSASWPARPARASSAAEAVVFPAIKSEVPKAVAKHKAERHRRERVHVLHRVRQHGALPDHRQGAADQPDRAADARGVPQRRRGRREGVRRT